MAGGCGGGGGGGGEFTGLPYLYIIYENLVSYISIKMNLIVLFVVCYSTSI